jgi:hypothetical protein
MATDFRDGKTFPRPGRLRLGDVLWLARVADKARAAAAGTIYDYVYPCPMDQGVFQRWGVPSDEFDAALTKHPDDASLLAWLQTRTDAAKIRAANEWLLTEKSENLNRQDAEEGVTTRT